MISVIIPTFNRALFLKRAITSVLSQTYRDLELIIVDDGSRDDTGGSIPRRDGRVAYIKQENKGPASARNLGIRNSRGGFIAFLDSDDWWARDKLATQMRKMGQSPSFPVSHTQEIWYRKGCLLNQKKRHKKFHGYIFDKCLPVCAVSMSTAMMRREVFEEVGLFDEAFPCCEDYDFWLRVSARHPFLLVDAPLTLKEGGRPDQVSSVHAIGMDRFRIDSIAKLLSSGTLGAEQRNAALLELEKKCRIYGNGCIKHGKGKEGRRYLEMPSNLTNQSRTKVQKGTSP